MSKQQLLILCGGKGTRLQSVWNKPKILAPVGTTTFLELLLTTLNELDLDLEVTLATGHLSKQIEKYLSKKNFDPSIIFEKEELGTGGAVLNYLNHTGVKRLTIMNGDTLYSKLDLQTYFKNSADLNYNSIGVAIQQCNSRYGSIIMKDTLSIVKPKNTVRNDTVFAGIMTISVDYLNFSSKFPFSLEELINSSNIPKYSIKTLEMQNGFYDIGTPEALKNVQAWQKSY